MLFMAHRITMDLPDDVWEDMSKRKFRNEGSFKDLISRAYRTAYSLPEPKQEVGKDEKTDNAPEPSPVERPGGDSGSGQAGSPGTDG